VVTFDSAVAGTTDAEWSTMDGLRTLPPLDFSSIARLSVVAAHPDDETLGAGGLMAECSMRGIPVQVVVVTDGAASHPESSTITPSQLAARRGRELFRAVSELAPSAEVVMLGFADGETMPAREGIAAALARAIEPGGTIVAPWRGDGHRDHRIVGEICAELAAVSNATLLEYPIWMWHWAGPDDERVPWDSAVSTTLTDVARQAKRRAIASHASQVEPIGPAPADAPVLTPSFLSNFDRDREVFLLAQSDSTTETKPQSYFDALYSRSADPWRLGTRWYEERKRAITVSSLPRARYRNGVEIGCSTGELTASLAERCDVLLAIDISAEAVGRASERTRNLGNVTIEQADATVSFPAGQFDLVVLSEVAYYWDRPTLERLLTTLQAHLADDATVVACHWRHHVADYPLGGNEANAIIRAALRMTRIAVHDERDFLLEVFTSDPQSVAAIEGLVEG
jgi:LmbE family N-acetylglucosaminyl deacetylase/SAM-dependent methyltransferase